MPSARIISIFRLTSSTFQISGSDPVEVVYAELSMDEIEKRIKVYEEKYGKPFSKYIKTFSCGDALPWEGPDTSDWENLTNEKADRLRKLRKPRSTK